MTAHKGLGDYLKILTENYRFNLIFNDYSGFMALDKELAEVLLPYTIHTSPFCMMVKTSRFLWDHCIGMKRGVRKKSRRTEALFTGQCHCGMGEYVVPILCKEQVLGVIFATGYCFNPTLSRYRIKKVSKEAGLNEAALLSAFEASVARPGEERFHTREQIEAHLGILADYLSKVYETLGPIQDHGPGSSRRSSAFTGEASLLSHAILYIGQNYQDKITVGELAAFCHCSESTLNHCFKKSMNLSIPAYTNKIRMEQAKQLLLESSDTMAVIASKTGFEDPNYFSGVFSRMVGMSPSEYKKRFRDK